MPTYQFARAHIVRGETKRAGLKDESAIARQNARLIEIEVLSVSLSGRDESEQLAIARACMTARYGSSSTHGEAWPSKLSGPRLLVRCRFYVDHFSAAAALLSSLRLDETPIFTLTKNTRCLPESKSRSYFRPQRSIQRRFDAPKPASISCNFIYAYLTR